MRKCKRCCLWAAPLALLLGLLVPLLAKQRIDNDLTKKARAALDAVELKQIGAKSNWGKVTLRGPSDLEIQSLAGAKTMKDHGAVQKFVYVDDGSPTSTAATTTTAAPTTTVATTVATTPATTTTVAATTTSVATTTTAAPAPVSVDVTADAASKQVTLTGFVASDAEKAKIVAAAVAAFGQANVVDQLTVKAGTPGAGVDGAVDQLAAVIGALGTKVDKGNAHLTDTKLTVSGTGFTTQATADANGVLAAAKAAGLTVDGTIAAPAAPDAATLQARLRDLLGRSGINFASGSANIEPASQAILDTAAESILQIPGVNIQVAGHTDDQGSAASNQTLSEQRANAVKTYLVGKGVPAAQLTAVGFGPTQPIAPNDSPEGRAQNRRIEFNVQ